MLTCIAWLQSSKVVAQSGSSPMQQIASCHAFPTRPSALQTVQQVQQVGAPHSTADETSSGLSQPLSSILSAAHQMASPKLAHGVVLPDKQQQQQQQPAFAPCKRHINTLGWQTVEASCTSVSGSIESDSLQQLQHTQAGACQEHGFGNVQDAELPQIAAAEAGQNCTSAESSSKSPAATMQHMDVVQTCQQLGLLSNQTLGPQPDGSKDVPGMLSQCGSEVEAGGSEQQHADSCAVACGHIKQRRYIGSISSLSSSHSECFSSAELDADAAQYDEQAGCLSAAFDVMPTNSWVGRSSLSSHASGASSGDQMVAHQQLAAARVDCHHCAVLL